MFDFTKSELAAKAKECNFIRDTLEKVLRLTDILIFINEMLLQKVNLHLKAVLRYKNMIKYVDKNLKFKCEE